MIRNRPIHLLSQFLWIIRFLCCCCFFWEMSKCFRKCSKQWCFHADLKKHSIIVKSFIAPTSDYSLLLDWMAVRLDSHGTVMTSLDSLSVLPSLFLSQPSFLPPHLGSLHAPSTSIPQSSPASPHLYFDPALSPPSILPPLHRIHLHGERLILPWLIGSN